MDDTPTIAAARRFLCLVLEGAPPTDDMLARALDELALAYHDAPDAEPSEDDSKPPRIDFTDYQAARSRLSARLPHYSHYPVADPQSDLDEKPVLVGAIDDLADICGDLQNAIWRSEALGFEDAHWHFKFDYQVHWGRHLRHFAFYLYETIGREMSER